MLNFDWNKDKNELLKKERGISFEDVTKAIDSNCIIKTIIHPNKKKYPNQKQYIIKMNNYIYVVPFVRDSKKIFLKTIIPDRKLTKKYLSK